MFSLKKQQQQQQHKHKNILFASYKLIQFCSSISKINFAEMKEAINFELMQRKLDRAHSKPYRILF